jgi:trimethylamine--corrinoid protein Co-methyltransferase
MRTGAPAFGTPESVLAILAGAQLARRYELPFRGGGGLASSNAVDGQAAAETAMMLWATYLANTDVVLHAAGWLEGGLTASLEKFALDVELLDQFELQRKGISFTDEEFAFDAMVEMGPGGLWLASPHTREHFKQWLYMSPIFQTNDYATWDVMGRRSTEQESNDRWKAILGRYEDPGLDPAIEKELREYIERRKLDPPEPDD